MAWMGRIINGKGKKTVRGKGWDLGSEPIRVKLCWAPSPPGITERKWMGKNVEHKLREVAVQWVDVELRKSKPRSAVLVQSFCVSFCQSIKSAFSICVEVRLLTSLVSMLCSKQGTRKGLRFSQLIPFWSNCPCWDFLGLLICFLEHFSQSRTVGISSVAIIVLG